MTGPQPTARPLLVLDDGQLVAFTIADLMRYHGSRSPGGVAHAFKVLERGLPSLEGGSPPERREITVRTAFAGPGARDGFELVTRAVTDGRYEVDASLRRPQCGPQRERFVFGLGYRGRQATLVLREGYVTEEFLELAGRPQPTGSAKARLTVLKQEMADRLMSSPAAGVYDILEE